MIDAWEQLDADVISCERCPRLREYCRQVAATKRAAFADWEYWGRPVPGFGDHAGRLLFVGLAPAAHGANRTGRIFTGDVRGASEFLVPALHRHGLANQPLSVSRGDGLRLFDCYVTAIVRCAPPENRPLPQEIANCRSYLVREIDLLRRLRVILALGASAFGGAIAALPSPPRGLLFAHGASYQVGPYRLVSSYHPSRQNTQTGKLTSRMFDEALEEALRAVRADTA